MNKKGFANILIIILAVVIIAGVAGYFLLNRNVKDKPQPITSTNSKNNSLPAGGAAGRGDEDGIRSPDGKRLIKIETSESEGSNGQSVYYVTVDGKNGKTFKFVGDAIFSPDSKQYAYAAGDGNKQFIVLNGRDLKSYDYVYTPVFSPNNLRFAYIAAIGQQPSGKQFIVLDGTEGKQYQRIELAFSDHGRGFSLNSNHIIYSAYENNKWFVVIDGKEGKKYDRVSTLTIRADGKKITYEGQIGAAIETITEALD